MGRTSVVMRGRGRHLGLWSCMHCGWITRGDTCMRGAYDACGGRVGWYAMTHPLRTVAIPIIARDERRESE